MINTELKRDNNGKLHLFVGGQHAVGSIVYGMDTLDGKLHARVLLPLDQVHLGEVTNVVPFVRSPS